MICLTPAVRRPEEPSAPGGRFVVVEDQDTLWLLTETELRIVAEGAVDTPSIAARLRDVGWKPSRIANPFIDWPDNIAVQARERMWVRCMDRDFVAFDDRAPPPVLRPPPGRNPGPPDYWMGEPWGSREPPRWARVEVCDGVEITAARIANATWTYAAVEIPMRVTSPMAHVVAELVTAMLRRDGSLLQLLSQAYEAHATTRIEWSMERAAWRVSTDGPTRIALRVLIDVVRMLSSLRLDDSALQWAREDVFREEVVSKREVRSADGFDVAKIGMVPGKPASIGERAWRTGIFALFGVPILDAKWRLLGRISKETCTRAVDATRTAWVRSIHLVGDWDDAECAVLVSLVSAGRQRGSDRRAPRRTPWPASLAAASPVALNGIAMFFGLGSLDGTERRACERFAVALETVLMAHVRDERGLTYDVSTRCTETPNGLVVAAYVDSSAPLSQLREAILDSLPRALAPADLAAPGRREYSVRNALGEHGEVGPAVAEVFDTARRLFATARTFEVALRGLPE